jgi:uncharacterized RDD family membrane protein YckC
VSVAAPPLFGDPVPATATPPPERALASFWRRLGAFVIDSIIVGLAAFVLGIPFFSSLSRLGPYGRLIGIILAFPYYVILNSKIGDGQTLGKRILDIQVVDESGHTVSFATSSLRYLVVVVPYFLSDVPLAATRTPWTVSAFLQALGIISAATLYLLIFNRRTRQGIHDLAAGTFVAQAHLIATPSKKPFWKPHLLIFASLIVVAYSGARIVEKKVMGWAPIPQMLEDVRLLEQMEGVQSAQALDQTSHSAGQTNSKRSLVITIHWLGESSNRTAFANQVAKTILAHDATVLNYDSLRIVVVSGYDIGIAKSNAMYSFENSPSEWNSLCCGTASPAKL